MEGVAGEGVRRRSKEYSDEADEAKVEDLTTAELVREKLQTREVIESDEETEVSTRETVEQIARELDREMDKEREVSKKLGEVLDELEREELEAKSTRERLREALDEVVEEESGKPVDKFSEGSTGHYGELRSKEEFDRVLEYYPETELRKNFEERYQESESYFDELERGERPTKPDLVEELEQKERRRQYEEENGGPPDVKIESMEDVDRLMEEQSDDTSKTSREYQSAETYFAIRDESRKNQHQLAEEYGVSQSKISNCQRGVETGLVKRLREREEERIIREWVDSKSVQENMNLEDTETRETIKANESLDIQRIEPEVVKESMKQIREDKDLGPKEVADVIDQMIRESPESESRAMMVDFPRSEIDDKMVSEFEKVLKTHRKEIQETLKESLEAEDSRVGMVKGRLYVWTPDRTPNDLVNAWHDQYFYMDNRDAARLADTSASRLGLGDSRNERLQNLNDLMQQLADNEPSSIPIKIKGNRSRMIGETLHVQRDVLGIRNQEVEGLVTKVTGKNGQGGISNPKLLEGAKLETWRAGLIGAALSDCHIRSDDSIVEYYEENLDRLNRFRDSLKAIGDFTNEPTFESQSNLYRLKLPSPYGRALNYWGVPSGDKAIKNPTLPSDFHRWSPEAKCRYSSEMTSEESNISKGRCSWPRSNIVRAGEEKSSTYEFESRISEEEVELIKQRGRTRSGEFEGDKTIPYGLIDDLKNDANPNVSKTAHQLEETIHNNRNKLIDSERDLYSDLGIDITVSPRQITYYGRTGRVSVKWEAKTSSSKATIRLAIICPPNHPAKEVALKKWLDTRNPEEIQSVIEDIENDKQAIPEEWRNRRSAR